MHTHNHTLHIGIKNKNCTRHVHTMNAFEKKCQQEYLDLREMKYEDTRKYEVS